MNILKKEIKKITTTSNTIYQYIFTLDSYKQSIQVITYTNSPNSFPTISLQKAIFWKVARKGPLTNLKEIRTALGTAIIYK